MWLPQLDDDARPKYLALVDAIARAIERGELKAGDRLPPQRRLAWRLGINPSTTMQAYREATRRHLVSGEVGRGTYVLADSKEATLFRLKQPDDALPRFDLSTNVPVAETLHHDVEAALRQLLQAGSTERFQCYLSADALTLGKSHAAGWLQQRGLHLSSDDVMLCAGAQQGLFATLSSLCQPGEAVLVEALTAPGIKAACRQLRLPLHGVALDRQGVVPDDLDRMARATHARVVVLAPTLHNPTGATMSAERQARIAEVVHRHGLLVVEDDVYGGLGASPPLTRRLGEQGLLVTSLSKTVAPGLRIGFIAGDRERLRGIDPEMQLTHWAVSPLCLSLFCQWVEDGTAERRQARQREEVAWRWRLAKKILGAGLGAASEPSPHVWVQGTGSSEAMVQACRDRGVEVVPAGVFAVKQEDMPAMRVSLSAARSRGTLKVALERIAEALRMLARE